ncbi:MAG: hypothetical protein Q9174_004161 [Haloplaca sp. 1 TL-2023]
MAKSSGYFALFPTASISVERVNEVLNKAEEGAREDDYAGWFYKYVPTKDALLSVSEPFNCTKTPVGNIPSEFLNNSLEELAAILTSAPSEIDLNREYFAVLDERTESDGSVLLCFIDDEDDEGKVDWVRHTSLTSSLSLGGMSMSCGSWDEMKFSWERKKQRGGGDILGRE